MKAGELILIVLVILGFVSTLGFWVAVFDRPVSDGFYIGTCSLEPGRDSGYHEVQGSCVYLHHSGMTPDPIVSKPLPVRDAADLVEKLNKDVEEKTADYFQRH